MPGMEARGKAPTLEFESALFLGKFTIIALILGKWSEFGELCKVYL